MIREARAGALRSAFLGILVAIADGAHGAEPIGALRDLVRTPIPSLELPKDCTSLRAAVPAWRRGLEAVVPGPDRSTAQRLAADRDKGTTEAEAWDDVAALAALESRPIVALWAELLSLERDWRPENVTDAGVYFAYLARNEESRRMLLCAQAMGYRSAYLFEALANVHDRLGDSAAARRFIGTARSIAPMDSLIAFEHSVITTGKRPAPRPRPRDPLDAALHDLERHQARVLAAVGEYDLLREQMNRALGVPDTGDIDRQADQVRSAFRTGNQAVAEARAQVARTPAEYRTTVRNVVLASYIQLYFSATDIMLQQFGRLVIAESFDAGFWGDAMGIPPVHYAIVVKQLSDYRLGDIQTDAAGHNFEDFGGAAFNVMSRAAAARFGDESQACRSDDCRHMAAVRYCDTMRALFTQWVDITRSVQNRAALHYDEASERYLAAGGAIVQDAFDYAARYAREIKLKRGGDPQQELVRDLQAEYRQLVSRVTDVREPQGPGPAEVVKQAQTTFETQRMNAEAHMRETGRILAQRCTPVEQESLDRHRQELRDAMSELLLYYLIRDLNISYDSLSCTGNIGKYVSIKIDAQGGTLGGKWTASKKAFGANPSDPDAETEVAGIGKVTVKRDGTYGAAGGTQGSAKTGPFTVSGDLTLGVQYKDGKWTYPVEMGGTASIGWKAKDGSGFSCSPGKIKMKFDARVIRDDAVAYLESLR